MAIGAGQYVNPLQQMQREQLWQNTGNLSPEQINQRLAQARKQGMSDSEIAALRNALWGSNKTDSSSGGLPGLENYTPLAGQEMFDALANLRNITSEPSAPLPDFVGEFEKSAPEYQQFDWKNMRPAYDKMAPKVSAYDYADPNIENVEDISGVPAEIWDLITRGDEEKLRNDFRGRREQATDQFAREGGERRAGLGALLSDRIASEEEKSVLDARRNAAIQRAQQEVGIRQNTQGLKASRATNLGSMQQRADEAQAAENARVAGVLGEEAKYKTGLEQAYQEAKAGENEKGYQTAYGRAQDVSGLRLTGRQQEQSEKQARSQAALARAQAAQGAASQVGTYEIQKGRDSNANDEGRLSDIYNAASGAGTIGGYAGGGGFSKAQTPMASAAPTPQPAAQNPIQQRQQAALKMAKTQSAV